MKAIALICAAALALSGCATLTPAQQENLQLELALAKQIGADAVSIWCATSGIIYVIANDINAKARVTVALGKNSQAATDACPMIAKVTGISVATAAQATAVTVVTTATPVTPAAGS